jgi:hypothetical protein
MSGKVVVVSPDKLAKLVREQAQEEIAPLLRVIAEMEAVVYDNSKTDREICSMLEAGFQGFRKGLLKTPWFHQYHELWKAARDSRQRVMKEPEAVDPEQSVN